MRLLAACLAFCFAVTASPVFAAETYDLIFKNGTLSDLSKDQTLEYDRVVSVPNNPEMSENQTGMVKLSFEADDMARLTFFQGEKYRKLGAFPATVGNPIVMYFVETVTRDVAQNAGGSPFYIRNRVKDSLIQFAEIVSLDTIYGDREIGAQQITLRPFLNDKNRERMRGYADLALTFTMSEDVPGWYHSLVAKVSPAGADKPIYSYSLTLQSGEDGQ